MVSFSSHFLHDVEGLAKAPKKPFRLVPKHQKGTGDMGCASVKVQEDLCDLDDVRRIPGKGIHAHNFSIPADEGLKLQEEEEEDEEEIAQRLSLHSWTLKGVRGVPLPPNGEMHQKHVKKLDAYLETVSAETLSREVSWKRLVHKRRYQEAFQ
ncbi:unnamed protein product [Durusdinium trenchii]|uniref:Uncharacterized protein n=1 Tax=Durusdinium trenchii TaxID=1381693 RepID=A0ABP0LFG0_9DINO